MQVSILTHNPSFIDAENESGVTFNFGCMHFVGDVLQAEKESGVELHDLIHRFRAFDAPSFSINSHYAKCLWKFPKWNIGIITHFKEILPDAVEEGVEDLPYSVVYAFPHGTKGAQSLVRMIG